MDESRMRRSALPRVWPKPRSNGSSTIFAWFALISSTLISRGRRNSVTERCITTPLRLPNGYSVLGAGLTPARRVQRRLPRVQLDNQVFVDVSRQVATFRDRLEGTFHLLGVHLDPGHIAAVSRDRESALNAHLVFRLFTDGNHVTGLDLVGGHVDGTAIDRNRLVTHQLTCFGTRRAEAHAVDDVVQAGFEQLQQNFTCCTGTTCGFFIVAAELLLEYAIHATHFLLLTKLQAVVGKTLTALAVHTRNLFGFTLFLEGSHAALQKEVGAFTTRQFTLRSNITSHESVSLNAAFLRRTAAIMGDGRRVSDALHAEAGSTECTHGGFTARTGTLDQHIDVFHTILGCSSRCTFACYLSSERGALARTTKTRTTGSCPRKRIALAVCDRHDRVVKRGMNVCNGVHYLLFNLFTVTTRVSHVDVYSCLYATLCVLLADRPTRTFAGARVRLGPLTTQRKTTAMTQTTIATQVHETLDVQRHITTKVTFYGVLANLSTQGVYLFRGEILNLGGRRDAGSSTDLLCTRTANPEDIGQRDRRMLVVRDIDACNTGHQLSPKFERLARLVTTKGATAYPFPHKRARGMLAPRFTRARINPDAACAADRCR